MKDLICITAHCPTPEKRQILLDLVLGLQAISKVKITEAISLY